MSVEFCCLAKDHGEVVSADPAFVHFTPGLAIGFISMVHAAVILGAESEAKAASLLCAGVNKVFVGEAALRDDGVMPRLLERFGAARVGLHMPVRRQAVSWSFDTASNADFRVVTPSLCEPAWEVLQADGSSSGVRATTCVENMLKGGVQSILLRADIADDTDLNLCAGMAEILGDKLWVAPLADPRPAITDWIEYGHARRLALPVALYRRRQELLPRARGAQPAMRPGAAAT